MKRLKIFAVCALLLSGCGSNISYTTTVNEETDTAEEAKVSLGGNIVTSFDGTGVGALGDTMQTGDLEFRLNSAYLSDHYETFYPETGMNVLVCDVTVLNTQETSLTLYDTDFQIQWGGSADTDFSVPITYQDEWADWDTYVENFDGTGLTGMYETSMTVAAEQEVNGLYVYQIPQGQTGFMMMFQEYFEDESVGDLYIVKFTALGQ